jgi:hypothetical protein
MRHKWFEASGTSHECELCLLVRVAVDSRGRIVSTHKRVGWQYKIGSKYKNVEPVCKPVEASQRKIIFGDSK